MDARADIIIYGSCHAQFLCHLLRETPSLNRHFSFHLVTNNVEPGTPLSTVPDAARRAVLVWEQYDQRPRVALREELLRVIPHHCLVVKFPAVGMNAFWPLRVKDPRNAPEPGFAWGRFPLGDRIALRVAKLGLSPADSYERYLEESNAAMPDVRHLLDLERSVFATRDAACDIAMSDVVFSRLRDTHQFWTHGHLAISLMSTLLLRLLERSAAIFGKIDDVTRAELAMLFARYPGQGEMQLPIHPAVIDQLGLTFVDKHSRYRWFGNEWTFETYMTRYIHFDRSWSALA